MAKYYPRVRGRAELASDVVAPAKNAPVFDEGARVAATERDADDTRVRGAHHGARIGGATAAQARMKHDVGGGVGRLLQRPFGARRELRQRNGKRCCDAKGDPWT